MSAPVVSAIFDAERSAVFPSSDSSSDTPVSSCGYWDVISFRFLLEGVDWRLKVKSASIFSRTNVFDD